MKVAAFVVAICGAVIGTGAALEFAYFGFGTPQFWAGIVATPAGALMVASAAAAWRMGRRASTLLLLSGSAMLAATAFSTYVDVMGPPAILIGALGGVLAIGIALRSNFVNNRRFGP